VKRFKFVDELYFLPKLHINQVSKHKETKRKTNRNKHEKLLLKKSSKKSNNIWSSPSCRFCSISCLCAYSYVCMCDITINSFCKKKNANTLKKSRSEDNTHKMAINSLKTDRRQHNAAMGGYKNTITNIFRLVSSNDRPTIFWKTLN
jgi:hypothetical protein